MGRRRGRVWDMEDDMDGTPEDGRVMRTRTGSRFAVRVSTAVLVVTAQPPGVPRRRQWPRPLYEPI
ncbi:hypothetical protein NLS1_25960 [Nocardioides sp. LS1]|nr:hypothetical protein NLS1_25960 [Nocardioides sp. LS1]